PGRYVVKDRGKSCSISFPQWQGHPACALLLLNESPVKTWCAGKSKTTGVGLGLDPAMQQIGLL
ncbi:MAG TPA: hypothetical protein VHN10_03840, partial [Candidatus Acidoferrales bacterium]|nr:hypothetical protein [Candidatus Acidoferrales bacterium]